MIDDHERAMREDESTRIGCSYEEEYGYEQRKVEGQIFVELDVEKEWTKRR